MPDTVLVTGASGFIGGHVAQALVDGGRRVRAMTRSPDRYDGPGTAVAADVEDAASLPAALNGVDFAYYLVHSLEREDFEQRDADSALNFARAAADAGVRQIVYLGGLGADTDELSPHLRSRRQVEQVLPLTGVPVTVLRAAVVIGHGSISWEITRQLLDRLPMLVTPRWANTLTQPIALSDAVRYLTGVLGLPAAYGRTFDIGGPEPMRYLDMLQRAAAVQEKWLPNISIPLLGAGLSSAGLAMITDVDPVTTRNLVESMSNEAVVREHSILDLLPGEPTSYEDAVRRALADRAADSAVDQAAGSVPDDAADVSVTAPSPGAREG